MSHHNRSQPDAEVDVSGTGAIRERSQLFVEACEERCGQQLDVVMGVAIAVVDTDIRQGQQRQSRPSTHYVVRVGG